MEWSRLIDSVFPLFFGREEEIEVGRSWQTNTLMNQEDTIWPHKERQLYMRLKGEVESKFITRCEQGISEHKALHSVTIIEWRRASAGPCSLFPYPSSVIYLIPFVELYLPMSYSYTHPIWVSWSIYTQGCLSWKFPI